MQSASSFVGLVQHHPSQQLKLLKGFRRTKVGDWSGVHTSITHGSCISWYMDSLYTAKCTNHVHVSTNSEILFATPTLWRGKSWRRSLVDIRSVQRPRMKPGTLLTEKSRHLGRLKVQPLRSFVQDWPIGMAPPQPLLCGQHRPYNAEDSNRSRISCESRWLGSHVRIGVYGAAKVPFVILLNKDKMLCPWHFEWLMEH